MDDQGPDLEPVLRLMRQVNRLMVLAIPFGLTATFAIGFSWWTWLQVVLAIGSVLSVLPMLALLGIATVRYHRLTGRWPFEPPQPVRPVFILALRVIGIASIVVGVWTIFNGQASDAILVLIAGVFLAGISFLVPRA